MGGSCYYCKFLLCAIIRKWVHQEAGSPHKEVHHPLLSLMLVHRMWPCVPDIIINTCLRHHLMPVLQRNHDTINTCLWHHLIPVYGRQSQSGTHLNNFFKKKDPCTLGLSRRSGGGGGGGGHRRKLNADTLNSYTVPSQSQSWVHTKRKRIRFTEGAHNTTFIFQTERKQFCFGKCTFLAKSPSLSFSLMFRMNKA